jgi:MFS family permease
MSSVSSKHVEILRLIGTRKPSQIHKNIAQLSYNCFLGIIMFNQIRSFAGAALRIKPQDHVPPEVAKHFPHNVLVNTLDLMAFFFGDSFVSINTIMPVFAATLTDNPIVIGLMPAIANAGWFLPQLFMAVYVSGLKKKLPFTVRMAVLERLPYLLLPIFALLVPQLAKPTAVALLLVIMILRGLGGGLVALPWQELVATVIPITHRSRYFGFSRVLGQTMGVIGSGIAALVLSRLAYPLNYAVGFTIAVVAQWISLFFFVKNREPQPNVLETPPTQTETVAFVQTDLTEGKESLACMDAEEQIRPLAPSSQKMIDLGLFGCILKSDANLRRYLVARSLLFIGGMGAAFLAVYGLKKFSLDDGAAAIFTGLIFMSGIIGNALFGAIGDRIGPKKVVVIAQVIWIAAMALVLLAPSAVIYYLVFVMFGLNSAGMIMGDSILVMELGDEKQRATYVGLTRTLTGTFVLLAPFVAGWLVEVFSYQIMFGVSVVFTVLGTLLFARVKDRPRHRELVEEALADN